MSPVSLALVLQTLAQSSSAASPHATVSDLERRQASAVVSAMAKVEQRLPGRRCIRFFVCVGDSDPSQALRERVHEMGYRAVRWCSDANKVSVPSGCERSTIYIRAPLAAHELASDTVFEAKGAVAFRCTNRIDAGRPTTIFACQPE